MNPRELHNKRVLIVGLGVTGASVARFFTRQGIAFDIADECDESRAAALAGQWNCKVYTQFEETLFASFEILVLSPGVPRAMAPVQAALAAGVQVIGDIELFAGVVDVPVIAVTGSNGKSTVVSWIAHVLQQAGINAQACGNIGLAALDSLDTQSDVFILELSSYQLESTCSLESLSAAVLNVSDDHMDRYDDIAQYAAVKRSVYKGAACCVVNHDDPLTWPDGRESPCECFTLSTTADSDTTRWHRVEKDGQIWLCDEQYALLPQAELALPGDHNAANALAVLALIEPLGIPFTALKSGLTTFAGLAHRTEFVGEKRGVRWYNDSKGTNVDACMKAIDAMPGPVVLIAGGDAKGADFRPLRKLLEERVHLLVLIGRDRDYMAAQLEGSTRIEFAGSLREAVETSRQASRPGDVVLLSPACASFDMFRNFEDRGEQFIAAVGEVLAA